MVAERLTDGFVTVFQRDEREGYATGFHTMLTQVRDGAELLARIRPDYDRPSA